MGMAVAAQVGIPAFWMAIMIGHGGNAAALSPFAPAGIIVNGIMDDIGLGGYENDVIRSGSARQHATAILVPHVDVGLGAFACAIVLAALKAGDESEASTSWRA